MAEAEGMKPINPNDPEARKAALIDLARQRGVPWEAIAAILGVPGKREAKKYREELGKRVTLRQAGVLEPAGTVQVTEGTE